MARIGIFQGEKKRWVQYDQDTEILIKHIGKPALSEINQKAQKTARLSGADAKDLFNQRLGRAAVLGWRNIDDHQHPGFIVDEQPLPFSEQNLDMLMRESLEFSAFVNAEAIDSQQFLDDAGADAAVKNA